MPHHRATPIAALLLALLCAGWSAPAMSQLRPGLLNAEPEPELPHHSLRILLDPMQQRIRVEDTITLPSRMVSDEINFALNSELSISNNNGILRRIISGPGAAASGNGNGITPAESSRYGLRLTRASGNQIQLTYSGRIYDVAEQEGAEYAQSFSETSGIIGEQGVFLSASSIWVPDLGGELMTFDMQVAFAPDASSWTAVSQGERSGRNGWASSDPMEEIYLIAADFTEYSQRADDVDVLAFLRTPDPNLATRYLDATDRYLQLYEPLLGEYPFSKFALVENFWETGYGMPSFTLLGEQVIRFPFILESSYPHEILHNWWGNGVYPDYTSGNWSEGLTAYLADHLFQEMNDTGHEYRKDMLARYKNYVADGTDFPLYEFTARNSAATQAVGYGKTLMLWHMLRLQLGDELFLEGLRQLYADYKFQRASYSDIGALFSRVGGVDLTPFFEQWVNRTGAPELAITVEEAPGNQARIMFAQTQFGEPYQLRVPMALYYEGEEEALVYDIDLTEKLQGVMAQDYNDLEAVLVDPWFDVFRRLDREETPPTIAELFGAEQISFILPATDRQHWTRMAEAFGQGSDFDILYADQLSELPADRPSWILGTDNPFMEELVGMVNPYGAETSRDGLQLDGNAVPYQNRSSVMVGRHPSDPELAIGWIHVDDMVAMPGMIEKLPHYGKYSYLSFVGAEPTNDVKGIWASPASPMQWVNPRYSGAIQWDALPASEPLATLPARYPQQSLMQHVEQLSAPALQGRGLGSTGLETASRYLSEQFRRIGLEPVGGSYVQRWRGSTADGDVNLSNVVGMIPGNNPALSARPIVLGAHYDHLGIDDSSGQAYPGADDNASGVSVLIEVAARLARTLTPQRPILFVAFTGEESGLLGSEYFVQNPPGRYNTEDLFAMINLDAVGRLEGRSLQVFGSDSAYEWPFMAQGIGFTIGVQSSFPQETIASSDHVSFLNAGIPAIHLFAGVHEDYHRVSDTPDKVDADGMSDVALWVEEAMVYLADRVDPLRVNLEGARIELSSSQSAREASLGTVPDFAYVGEGIRISGVTPDSAAALAGLQAGDVLLSFNGTGISDLQSYSNLLRESAPGDSVQIDVRRGDQSLTVEAVLKAR